MHWQDEEDDGDQIVTRQNKFVEEWFQDGMRNLPRAIEEYGFTSLRPGQEKVIRPILAGTDVFCILPTGMGKTACFVIPALAHNWRLLVFSPLRALMKDQVEGLMERGIVAMSLSSDNGDAKNAAAIRHWISGECKILYVAPERLFSEPFLEAIRRAPPQMIAIDETHVLEAWGDNFRSSYTRIGDMIDRIQPKVIMALTATSSPEVEESVRRVFRMENAQKIDHYVRRENLKLSSSEFRDIFDVVEKIEDIDGRILIYCGTRARCYKNAAALMEVLGEPVGVYHAGVERKEKELAQQRFKSGEVRIMCATNAFGMGVDIPQIRGVIHIMHPGDPEALAQELGRAGRDGNESWCHTFSSKEAIRLNRQFIANGNPMTDEIIRVAELFEEKCDGAGVVKMPKILIARLAAVPFGCVDAIREILLSSRVVEPVKDSSNIKWVKIIREQPLDVRDPDEDEDEVYDLDPVSDFDPEGFREFMEEVADAALDRDDDGFIAYDASMVAVRLGITVKTLNGMLIQWCRQHVIYSLSAGDPCRIIGDISLVDFKRLELKREKAYQKLEYVRGYFKVKNEEKHAYLEAYFNSQNA